MKRLILTASIFLLGATTVFAQKYMTRTGKIYFNATTPTSPEKIEGKNNELAAIVDSKNGDIVFQALVKSFKFERELMQEHFNENYMESDKFPKSDFKGTITNITQINFLKDGSYPATVSGKLTMHGVSNNITVPGTITVKGNQIILKAKFSAKLSDYKIAVPSVVADKIDKVVTISIDADLDKK